MIVNKLLMFWHCNLFKLVFDLNLNMNFEILGTKVIYLKQILRTTTTDVIYSIINCMKQNVHSMWPILPRVYIVSQEFSKENYVVVLMQRLSDCAHYEILFVLDLMWLVMMFLNILSFEKRRLEGNLYL